MKKQLFFTVKSVADCVRILQGFPTLAEEALELTEADGRVLARAVVAQEDLPLAARACMDGYAVRAADLFGASGENPAYLECIGEARIDAVPQFTVAAGQCAGIVTGGLLPDGADAVIMVEYTDKLGEQTIEMQRSVAPFENVIPQGEDARQGQEAIAAGTLLRAPELGFLAALGAMELMVHRQPTVGIISTGDEVIPPEEKPRLGQVRDVNSLALLSLCRIAGALPTRYGIVPDSLDSLSYALRRACEHEDVVLLSGGSSVGLRDHTLEALSQLPEADILMHGVALKPGKPLILARTRQESGESCTVWGLPGQVTSAQVVMQILGIPFLQHIQGNKHAFDQSRWPARRAVLERNIASQQGREDYVRVMLVPDPSSVGTLLAKPVFAPSGVLKSMLLADGLVRVAPELEGLSAGEEVDVLLWR